MPLICKLTSGGPSSSVWSEYLKQYSTLRIPELGTRHLKSTPIAPNLLKLSTPASLHLCTLPCLDLPRETWSKSQICLWLFFFFFFFPLFWPCGSSLGQGLNPSQSCDLSHSCTWLGMEPTVLILLGHSGNS